MSNNWLFDTAHISTMDRVDMVEGIMEMFEEAGLVPPADATDNYARSHTLVMDALTENQAEAEQNALVTDLASGDLTIAEAVGRAVVIEQRGKTDGLARRVVRLAHLEALRGVIEAFETAGDTVITDQLRPEVEKVVSEATVLAGVIGEISTDAEATYGTPKQLDAWLRLRDLTARWYELHYIAETLRRFAILPHGVDASYFPIQYRYENPDAVPLAPYEYAPMVLVDAIRRGAGPTVRTYDEVHGTGPDDDATLPGDPFENAFSGGKDR